MTTYNNTRIHDRKKKKGKCVKYRISASSRTGKTKLFNFPKESRGEQETYNTRRTNSGAQARWCILLMPALRRQRKVDLRGSHGYYIEKPSKWLIIKYDYLFRPNWGLTLRGFCSSQLELYYFNKINYMSMCLTTTTLSFQATIS